MNPKSPLREFQEAHQLMLQAQRVVIISHKNPDADAVGANLALREALERLGKTVSSACVDLPPEDCDFLPGYEDFVQEVNFLDYDLVVSVDCGGHKVLGFHEKQPELLDRGRVKLVNIDHHESNDHFGNVNIVMPQTPSTCFILYLMFTSYGWNITQTMATALLHGLYFDTGSFMHSNTDAQTLRIAGRLKALGGNHELCVKKQFKTKSIEKLRLWGLGLSRAELNSQRAVVSAIRQEDLKQTGADLEDLSGLINYLNHVPESRFCVLLTEDGEGKIKSSMRTLDDKVDLSKIAELFGGGGHKKAAGFTISGRIQEKRVWMIS